MWRRNAPRARNSPFVQENQDSDQSISEEEDLGYELTENAISLDGSGNNKKKGGYHTDDEVEFSLFNEEDGSSHYPRISPAIHTIPSEGMIYLPTMASISHSEEEIISDDEKINPPILKSTRENMDGTWSEATREVEALVYLNENFRCPSSHGAFVKDRKSSEGGESRKRAKPKFIFRLHSRKEDLPTVVGAGHGRASSHSSPSRTEDMDEFTSGSQLIYHNKECKQPEDSIVPFEPAHEHDFKEHSVAEFLYSFEESSNHLQGSSQGLKKRGRRAHMVLQRNTSPLDGRNLDEDDSLEVFDSGSPSCSDDEENHRSLKLAIPGRTMADQFHDAFGTVSVTDERQHLDFLRTLCSGMYGKLQLVMQSEKERDMDYLKNLNTETGFKDARCISVRILTRSLEAKLVVCCCTPVEDGKISYLESNLQMGMKDVPRTLTIIFNSRICRDVELEVGNLICIHPPWKEVQVKGKDDVVYLCSYFTLVRL